MSIVEAPRSMIFVMAAQADLIQVASSVSRAEFREFDSDGVERLEVCIFCGSL